MGVRVLAVSDQVHDGLTAGMTAGRVADLILACGDLPADYLAAPGMPADVVTISAPEMAADRAWLGLRTSDGIDEATLPTEIVRFVLDGGLAERRANRICPTLRGFLMADRIAARIIEAL